MPTDLKIGDFLQTFSLPENIIFFILLFDDKIDNFAHSTMHNLGFALSTKFQHWTDKLSRTLDFNSSARQLLSSVQSASPTNHLLVIKHKITFRTYTKAKHSRCQTKQVNIIKFLLPRVRDAACERISQSASFNVQLTIISHKWVYFFWVKFQPLANQSEHKLDRNEIAIFSNNNNNYNIIRENSCYCFILYLLTQVSNVAKKLHQVLPVMKTM